MDLSQSLIMFSDMLVPHRATEEMQNLRDIGVQRSGSLGETDRSMPGKSKGRISQ